MRQLIFVAIFIVGCNRDTQPEKAVANETRSPQPSAALLTPDLACDADADCVLTTMNATSCCDGCQFDAVSANWHQQLRDYCGTAERDCPHLDCSPPLFDRAACVDGKCVAVANEAAD